MNKTKGKTTRAARPRGKADKVTAAEVAAGVPVVKSYADFEALSDADKEKVYQSVDREIRPEELRPLNAEERKQWNRWKKKSKAGRPRVGKGAKIVTISLERDLLNASNRFAKQRGVKRSEMVAAGLRAVMRDPSLLGDQAA